LAKVRVHALYVGKRKDGVIFCYVEEQKAGDPEIGIRKRVSNKIKDIWPKTGLYLKNTMRNGKCW
jgi:hypothetical protein